MDEEIIQMPRICQALICPNIERIRSLFLLLILRVFEFSLIPKSGINDDFKLVKSKQEECGDCVVPIEAYNFQGYEYR